MKLADWMQAQGLGDEAVAARLGVNRSTINRVRNGKTTPSGRLLAAIFDLTEGAVTPSEFFPEERIP